MSPFSRGVDNSYLDAWRAKHALLVAPGQNRLILAGGSNVAFGVDSAQLETMTRRATINLGLHGGLGLALMLNEVEEGARAGDLVVLVPEYEHFYGDLLNGELTASELVQRDWSALRYFSSVPQWWSFAKNSRVLISSAMFGLVDKTKTALSGRVEAPPAVTVYRGDAFDEHGDMVAHLDEEPQPEKVTAGIKRIGGAFNPKAIDEIARCADILRTRGTQFVVLYPPVAAGYWAVNQDLAEMVATRMGQWTLTAPADWVFDDRLFYDTFYHLNRTGREMRTQQIARVLRTETAAVR